MNQLAGLQNAQSAIIRDVRTSLLRNLGRSIGPARAKVATVETRAVRGSERPQLTAAF
jgi:hypothetical protein